MTEEWEVSHPATFRTGGSFCSTVRSLAEGFLKLCKLCEKMIKRRAQGFQAGQQSMVRAATLLDSPGAPAKETQTSRSEGRTAAIVRQSILAATQQSDVGLSVALGELPLAEFRRIGV